MDAEDPAAQVAEAALEFASRDKALDRCLATLAPEVRQLMLLRYVEELTFEEIGGMLAEKPGTLQARAARAMPGLRACLEEKGISL